MKTLFLGAALLISIASFAQPKTSKTPSLRLIRNATLVIEYAGKKILVDPMLSSKGAFESFAGVEINPTVELKMPVYEIVEGVDLVLVTHTHVDHFDNLIEVYVLSLQLISLCFFDALVAKF